MVGMIESHGENVIVHNFEQVGTDSYGDPIYDETTVERKAVFEMTRQPRSQSDAMGERPVTKPVVYVSSDVEVTDQLESTRGSEITRSLDNTRFKVLSSFNEGNGFLKLDCEER